MEYCKAISIFKVFFPTPNSLMKTSVLRGEEKREVTCVCGSRDRALLAAGCEDGTVRIWNTTSETSALSFRCRCYVTYLCVITAFSSYCCLSVLRPTILPNFPNYFFTIWLLFIIQIPSSTISTPHYVAPVVTNLPSRVFSLMIPVQD